MRTSPEHWLSIDLSSSVGTLAIHQATPDGNPRLLKEAIVSREFQHSEMLLTTLSNLLVDLGIELSNLRRLISVSGPGSFTGLRIAMASLKAFALALNLPIEILNSSEARAIAWSQTVSGEIPSGEVLVITQASAQ